MAAVQGYVDADEFNTMPKTTTEVTEETNQQVVIDNTQTGLDTGQSKSLDTITDFSNVPYQFHSFSTINDVGKRWIMKYYLSLCKEIFPCGGVGS